MMYNKNRPNIVPADNESIAGLLQFSFASMIKSVQTLLPAKIIKYDRTKNRAQVQLLIKVVGTSGESIENAQIASIPVMLLGGGDFFISFDLKTDDLGWVFATDRDISLFLQSYKSEVPAVDLVKNFSSSFFIPDIMHEYTISSEDAESTVISNRSASVKISLNSDTISITAPQVIINGDATVTGKLITDYIAPASGNLYIEGSVQAEGTFTPDVPPPP